MDAPQPLSPRATPPPVARLNRKVILPLAALLCLGIAYAVTRGLQPPTPKARIEPLKVEGRPASMPDFLRQPLPLTPTLAQATPTDPPALPLRAAQETPPVIPPSPPRAQAIPPPPPLRPPPQFTPSARPAPQPPERDQKPQGLPRSLFPSKSPIATPPFPEEKGSEAASKATGLIAQAQWAQCAARTKCLYETQLIHGQIVQAINSDIPGAIWIKVTNDVTDMFGQGQVLIPQGATLVGAQQGQPKVGQERLDFLVQRGIFPDGTVLSFAGSRIGDATGATGIPGTVNNHYVKLGIATVLTAALSVGAREVGGTSTSFRSTPEEEFGRDIAGSVNTTGRDIIRRQLVQGPTITREPGAAVVIQLKETVSLQTPPQIVKQ